MQVRDLVKRVYRWLSTGTPTQVGELGMDVATGRLLVYVAGSVRSLAHTDELGGGGGIGGSTGGADNAVLRSDGVGGSTLQASGIILDDLDNITGVGELIATKVTTGDLAMRARYPDGSVIPDDQPGAAHWRFVEAPDQITVINELTGQRFRLPLIPDSPNSQE